VVSLKAIAAWFAQLAVAVDAVVEQHHGVVGGELSQWKAACQAVDPELHDAPEKVWEHFTCPLRPRSGLLSFGQNRGGSDMIVVYNPNGFRDVQYNMRSEQALAKCEWLTDTVVAPAIALVS
jgi:hypothetical protein